MNKETADKTASPYRQGSDTSLWRRRATGIPSLPFVARKNLRPTLCLEFTSW
jgi:hypothetical protein